MFGILRDRRPTISPCSHATVFKNKVAFERESLTVGGQNQNSTKDAHVVSYQLHLVPELHLAGVVPVAQVTVDEQDDQGQHDGQDLSRQTHVTPREERQSKPSKQHLQQHQGDLSSHDVVQVGQLVLFTVLEGVHLVGERGTASVSVPRPADVCGQR